MSKRLIGIVLVLACVAAFHLLGSHVETPPVWSRAISAKVFSDPVAAGNNFVFLGGDKGKRSFKLFEVDAAGTLVAESPELNSLPFQPIALGNMVITGDSSRMVRGFSVPGLKLVWENGTVEQFRIAPMKADNERILIQSTASTIFCIDSRTGKPVWEYTFPDSLVNYAVGKVIVCLHGYNDLKEPKWKATALNPEDGSVAWTFAALPLGQDTPLFVQNICVMASNEGEIMIFDQDHGTLLHKNEIKGLKASQILDDILIMLASGGSRIVCMSLMTGASWSTTVQAGYLNAARYGNRLMLCDKKALRCLDANTGEQLWKKDLSDAYNAFPHRRGIFVTHKDSFFARTTYGSYIETDSNRTVWATGGRSLFMKPLVTNAGDLLLSYDGYYMMMPKPAYELSSDQTPIADPTQNSIKFWKDETATPSADVTASSSVPQPAPAAQTDAGNTDITGNTPVSGGTDIDIDDGWKKTD